MSDDFYTSQQPVTSDRPRPTSANAQRQQLEAALTSARSHLATLQGKHAHNALAISIQQKIIKQYEARIASLSEDTWLN